MKHYYEMPEMELISLLPVDVLTGSGAIWNGPDYEDGGNPDDNNDNTVPGDDWLGDDFWN